MAPDLSIDAVGDDVPSALHVLDALRLVLRSSHSAGADDLPGLAVRAAARLSAVGAVIYLVDYDQVVLVPLAPVGSEPGIPAGDATGSGPDELAIEGTVAGRVFREVVQHASALADGGHTVWTPMVDGSDRLGVLRIDFPTPSPVGDTVLGACRDLATLMAELVTTRSEYGDAIERARRRSPMSVPAEMQWRLLPPLTFAAPHVTIAGVLVPTNQVAGDSFDYSLNGPVMHVAIFDAMGHGLEAALLSTVAVATLRNARRTGRDLSATVQAMDAAIGSQFGGDKFVTGIVGELDTTTGWWRWITCGHHPALLVRSGRVVKVLDAVIDPPLGLGILSAHAKIGEERLQPGDRVLLYTDGMIEARDASGEFFGPERLVQFTAREAAAERPVAETLRRLTHAILRHQHGMMQDDASTVLVEWISDQPGPDTP